MVTRWELYVLLWEEFFPNVVDMFPIDTATAEAVREVIADAGRSQAAVARDARFSPSTWHRRISAKTSFTAAELSRIVTALGLTITDLFDTIAEKRR